ncbi:MAG: hypothetical protein H0U92_08175 [Actinobacteria bacterium]|nr:hypothetical protein [Actinomycetota bacterium]
MRRLFGKRNDRGAALILVAASLVATISVTGLVVDGSNAFSQRRQMQNAADAAALSAARRLDQVTATGDPSVVRADAVSVAVSNGADSATLVCSLVDETGTIIAACPTTSTPFSAAMYAAVAGVRVAVKSTSNTSFMRVAGIKTFTAAADATAQVQGLRSGNSPFVLCAVGSSDPRSMGDGQTTPVLTSDNSVNSAAFGLLYRLQNPVVPGCGQGNTFKGLTQDFATDFSVPGNWAVYNGDHGVNVQSTVIAGANACRGALTNGCLINVPLCYAATPAASGALYCVRFGVFAIDNTQGASKISGRLVDKVPATGGQGGGKAQPGELRVIKLTE